MKITYYPTPEIIKLYLEIFLLSFGIGAACQRVLLFKK